MRGGLRALPRPCVVAAGRVRLGQPRVGRPARLEDNWSNSTADPESAALLLVEALRDGRQCADPRVFTWRIDRFPPPDDDGERAPALPRGPFGLAA